MFKEVCKAFTIIAAQKKPKALKGFFVLFVVTQ